MHAFQRSFISVAVGLTAHLFAGGVFAQAQPDVLKVGIMATMSGGGASYGIAQCRGWKMAAEDVNKKGGVTAGGKKFQF